MAAPLAQGIVAGYQSVITAKQGIVTAYVQELGNGYAGVVAGYSQNDAAGEPPGEASARRPAPVWMYGGGG